MITFNKVKAYSSFSNIQREKKETKPVFKQLKKDTVSFGTSFEKSFLKDLRKLYKDGWNTFIGERAEVLAYGVDPKHPDIVAELEKIKNDPSVENRVKYFVTEELPEVLGKGGLEKL